MMRKKSYKYSVCIKCMTYNHSSFIRETLDGFSNQRTTFQYVAVIVDDASTDGNQSVILEYFHKHFEIGENSVSWQKEDDYANYYFARHKENHNCFFGVLLLKRNQFRNSSKDNHIKVWENRSKYIALCEGDDYWTDPCKLQKQVDFMDHDADCSLCFHKVKVLTTKEEEKSFFENLEEREYTPREIYETWTIPTCSVLYRNLGIAIDKRVYYGDIYLWLRLSEQGKLFCLDFCGGVYRRHSGSLTSKMNPTDFCLLADQYKYMGKRFPKLRDISRRKEESYLKHIIHMPYFDGIWKYRFRYMFLHPNLFFSTFFTTTILSYTPFRHH